MIVHSLLLWLKECTPYMPALSGHAVYWSVRFAGAAKKASSVSYRHQPLFLQHELPMVFQILIGRGA